MSSELEARVRRAAPAARPATDRTAANRDAVVARAAVRWGNLAPSTARRRSGRLVLAAIAVGLVLLVAVAAVVLRHPASRTQPAPANKLPVHNGSLGVFGGMNGVRSLTRSGAGKFIFECTETCTFTMADWSPDGTRLAFTTTCGPSCSTAGETYNGIHVVDLVRGTDRQVVHSNDVGELAWSPDGTRIAYVKERGAQRAIWVMNADGSGQAAVTPFLSDAGDPSWSPGGSRIVYTGRRGLFRRGLFVVGLNGQAPASLGVEGANPTWSPDGSKIAYINGRPGSSGCEIREITPDRRHDVSLIDLAAVSKRCSYLGDLEWSPDGAQIAALVSQEVAPRKGYTAVYIVQADGTSARSLTGWIAGQPWGGLVWRPVP